MTINVHLYVLFERISEINEHNAKFKILFSRALKIYVYSLKLQVHQVQWKSI
jgi:hypothetical protein